MLQVWIIIGLFKTKRKVNILLIYIHISLCMASLSHQIFLIAEVQIAYGKFIMSSCMSFNQMYTVMESQLFKLSHVNPRFHPCFFWGQAFPFAPSHWEFVMFLSLMFCLVKTWKWKLWLCDTIHLRFILVSFVIFFMIEMFYC